MMKLIIIIYLTFSPVLSIDSDSNSNQLIESFNNCLKLIDSSSKEGINKISNLQWFRTKMKVQKKEWQIINGTEADISEFPYMSLVYFCNPKRKYAIRCGGNIISDNYILTAAHCATKNSRHLVLDPEDYVIEVGSSFWAIDGYSQFKALSEVHVHPKYTLVGTQGRDLSVLKLKEKLSMSNRVATIPVASHEQSYQLQDMEKSNTECVIAGWGITYKPETLPIRLRSVKLPLMPIEVCIQLGKLAHYHITREEHLCTYRRYKDTCQGDSGGGLVCKGEDGVQRLWGVTSFGEGCAKKLRAGYYARVDNADAFLKPFMATKSSPSAATLERALLKLLFPLFILVKSSI